MGILPRKKAGAGAAPTGAQMVVGELGANVDDGTLYYKRTDGGVETFLGGGAIKKSTLIHAAGLVSLDVASAGWFEFTADDYAAPSQVDIIGIVGGSNNPDGAQPHASTQPGDLVVFGYFCRDDSSYFAGSGWNELVGEFGYYNASQTFRVLWQIVGDPVTVDVDVTKDAAAKSWAMITLRGHDSASPLDTVHSFHASTGLFDLGPITSVTDDALALMLFGNHQYGSAAFTPPAGYTLQDHFAAGTGFVDPGFAVLSKALPQAVTEDPASVDTPGNYTMGALLAVRPQVGSGEKDYTLSLTSKPASVIKPIMVILDVKTAAGSWDVSTIDEWIGGAPDLNVVGKHAIQIAANTQTTVGRYLGQVA